MLGQFDSLKNIVRVKYYTIDNTIFKLHYRITFYIFLVATILVTSRQYIGEHIKCIADSGVASHVMDTFCFFTTTFTIAKYHNSTLMQLGGVAHPGVGPVGLDTDETIIRHAYYQWVPFVLFAQAIMFYLPHILWKSIEGGKLQLLAEGLKIGILSETDGVDHDGIKILSKEERNSRLQEIRNVITNRAMLNKSWSYYFIFCEHINFLNVILQAYIIDSFLGGQFFALGHQVIEKGFDGEATILEYIFPKVTKCTFHKYGPSGSIQSHDAMCVMALNIINEKIYVFLWFWLIFLFLCSGIGLLYRYLSLILHARSTKFNELIFSSWRPAKLTSWKFTSVTKYFTYTDWLFLNYLSENMDGLAFRELFVLLAGDNDVNNKLLAEDKDKTMLIGYDKQKMMMEDEKSHG